MTSQHSEGVGPASSPSGRLRVALADHRTRFLLVGTINTAIGFALFVAADLTVGRTIDESAGRTAGSLVTLAISHVGAVLIAFALYRRFVFPVKGHLWRDLARFESVYIGALAFNAIALPLLVAFDIPRIIAQAGILAVSAIGSYVGHRYFSFRRSDDELSAGS